MVHSGAQAATPERVREAVEEVLSGPDFRDEASPLEDAFAEFFEWFFGLFPDTGPAPDASVLEMGLQVVWILILVIAAGLLARVIWNYVRAVRLRESEVQPTLSEEVAARVRDLRHRAREAEVAGDFTLALRLYFFALVIGLGQRGELEYNSAWTNRELLERGEPHLEVAKLLRPLVGELDAHSFGEEPTQPEEVQRFADLCEDLLGGAAA